MATTTFKVTNQNNHKISSMHKHPFNEGSCPANLYQITAVSWSEYFTSSNIRTYKYSFYFYGDSNSPTVGPYSKKINSNGGAVQCSFSETGLTWARTVVTGSPGIYCSQSNSSLDSEAYWRGTDSQPTVVTFTYTAYGNVGAPGSVSATASGTTATVSWTAGSKGTGTTVASYTVGYATSTSSTPSGQKTATSPTTFTGLTAGTTYYFAVRSNSSPSGHNSGWKWSGGVTMGSHPTVSTGAIIFKTDMDSLRSWKGNSPTAVTQGAVITAAVGNTYRATSNPISASWYNGA